jgi:hypothetical protein
VEVTTYEKVTDFTKIPFEHESVVFMAQSIKSQQRQLVQEALNQGLKLKALDEDIKTEAQKRRAQSQMCQRPKGALFKKP